MRRPNGKGSVYKLPGNRRKPWAVRVTLHEKDSEGRTLCRHKYLGYYETWEDADNALAHYRKHPYNVDAHKITFEEVFEIWFSSLSVL